MVTIRKAKDVDIPQITKLVDRSREVEAVAESLNDNYYKYLIRGGVVLVAEQDKDIVGVCFGTVSTINNSAMILGLVVRKEFRQKGFAKKLIEEFESVVKKKKVNTINFNADRSQGSLLSLLNYQHGHSVIPFRKRL